MWLLNGRQGNGGDTQGVAEEKKEEEISWMVKVIEKKGNIQCEFPCLLASLKIISLYRTLPPPDMDL